MYLFTETLEFIDYEMCDYNYAAFDIASYMVTQAGNMFVCPSVSSCTNLCVYLTRSTTLTSSAQWRIQEFPEGGAPTPKVGVLTYYFAIFLPKTA